VESGRGKRRKVKSCKPKVVRGKGLGGRKKEGRREKPFTI